MTSIATVSERPMALAVNHVWQLPAATISFNTAAGVSLGHAVDAIKQAAQDIGMPRSLTMEFLGAAGAYQKSLTSQLLLILAALVCVYIVLGVLYESYVHPMTILSTLPSAGVGYRFEFKPRVNVRLDYGIGKGSSGFYFQVGEAF